MMLLHHKVQSSAEHFSSSGDAGSCGVQLPGHRVSCLRLGLARRGKQSGVSDAQELPKVLQLPRVLYLGFQVPLAGGFENLRRGWYGKIDCKEPSEPWLGGLGTIKAPYQNYWSYLGGWESVERGGPGEGLQRAGGSVRSGSRDVSCGGLCCVSLCYAAALGWTRLALSPGKMLRWYKFLPSSSEEMSDIKSITEGC